MPASKGLERWVLGSAALMVIGAFGPWLRVLGQSVGGTDGSNDGWLVVAFSAIGALLFYMTRTRRAAGVWAFLGGAAGAAVTLYDRSNVQNAIHNSAFAQALVQVGWGLNLALAASVSMTVAGAVYWFKAREHEQLLPPPASAPPPVMAVSSPTASPTTATPPPPHDAPTPPPD